MDTKRKTKTEFIKIRITKEEKEKLKQAAASEHESISSFILRKSLHEDSDLLYSLPKIIDTLNFINEIHHRVEKSSDGTLKKDIGLLCHKHITNYRMEG